MSGGGGSENRDMSNDLIASTSSRASEYQSGVNDLKNSGTLNMLYSTLDGLADIGKVAAKSTSASISQNISGSSSEAPKTLQEMTDDVLKKYGYKAK
jgi:hypothetical protein